MWDFVLSNPLRKAALLSVTCMLQSALALPTLVSVSPADQSQVAPQGVQIMVKFSSAIDPTTVTGKTFYAFASSSGPLAGTFAFEDANKTIRYSVTTPVTVGEVVKVNLSKTISGTGGPSSYFWQFRIVTGKVPTMTFTNIKTIRVKQPGETTLLRTYGAYAGDLNHDGWGDLSVVNEDAGDVRIYISDKKGGFVEPPTRVGIKAGSAPSTNKGADYNLDGHLDFAVGQIQGNGVSVLWGDGAGKLTLNATYQVGGAGSGLGTRGLCALDLNGDNYYDLVAANRVGNNISILMNNGTTSPGTYKPATHMEATVDGETSCASGDFNRDGFEDVAIGGYNDSAIAILLSDGSGSLRVGSKQVSHSPWMIQTGDYNNDGNVDVIAVNNLRSKFSLLRGDGKGVLGKSEYYVVGSGTGSTYASLAIDGGDLNGDGNLDVVVSNFSNGTWTVYQGTGGGLFGGRQDLRTENSGSDATLHDRDLDGDLDITGVDENVDLIHLFDNVGKPINTNPYRIVPLQRIRNFHFDPVGNAFIFDVIKPTQLQFEIRKSDGKGWISSPRMFEPGMQTLSTYHPGSGMHWVRVTTSDHLTWNHAIWVP